MVWFDIYAQDALEAWRVLKRKASKHPFLTLWFLMLAFGFVWLILRFYSLSLEEAEGGLFVEVDTGTLFLMIFIIFFAKSVSNATRKIVQSKSLVFHLSQPSRQSSLLYGKIFTEIVINVGLFTAFIALIVSNILLFDFHIPSDPWFVANAVILTIFGTILGVVFSIFNVFPFKKKLLLMMLIVPFLVSFYSALTYLRLSLEILFLLFWIMTGLSFVLIVPSNLVFLEAWNIGTNPGKSIKKPLYSTEANNRRTLIGRFMDEKTRALLKREIAEKFRSRAFLGMVVTITAISYGTAYATTRFDDIDLLTMRFGYLLSPLVVGLGIFAAALLEPGISTLGSVGKEGKNLWILKSSPLKGSTIIQAKALASLISIPFIIAGPAIAATLYLGYSIDAAIFSAIGAITMVLLLTGIGAWFGARYPNFDENVKGNPDIMTMYVYAMVALFFASIFCTIPLLILFFDRFLGFLAIIFFGDLAALVLYLGTILGGVELDKLEVN